VSVDLLDRETLDVRSAARVLGVSEPSLRRAVAAGDMPTISVPGIRRILFSRKRIEGILRDDGNPTTEVPHAEGAHLNAA
jgi:excisionase family DNA binding protein